MSLLLLPCIVITVWSNSCDGNKILKLSLIFQWIYLHALKYTFAYAVALCWLSLISTEDSFKIRKKKKKRLLFESNEVYLELRQRSAGLEVLMEHLKCLPVSNIWAKSFSFTRTLPYLGQALDFKYSCWIISLVKYIPAVVSYYGCV